MISPLFTGKVTEINIKFLEPGTCFHYSLFYRFWPPPNASEKSVKRAQTCRSIRAIKPGNHGITGLNITNGFYSNTQKFKHSKRSAKTNLQTWIFLLFTWLLVKL